MADVKNALLCDRVDARISASGALQSRIVAGNLPLLHL